MKQPRGYILIMLMLIIIIMSIGLIVAVPIWQTQIQRENEEELIFRGNQYVEAVRIFQLKNPGSFPRSLDELVEKKCLRRLYRDPMTPDGEWNIVLHQEGMSGMGRQTSRQGRGPLSPQNPQTRGQTEFFTPQKIMVAPLKALSSIQNAQILGVVSTSTKKSIRVFKEQESYDKWLFYYGQDPNKLPEIVYYGQPAKTP
jgi:type II secretory pathway pseudopilin PulG